MCSRADKAGYPPPLPLKQRRSANSGGSSTGSSVDLELEAGERYSLLGSPYEAAPTPLPDVFSSSIDCHAPRCPIHHSDGHQERFFSESTPPPVPKKRLARAVSLPGGCLHPRCSLPSRHQNYDNPLYMLAPIRDGQPEVEKRESQKPAFQAPPPPRLPLGLLTFDTPDPQLPHFFGSLQDQEQVSSAIQECHLLFLKRIARQLETLPLGWAESAKGIESSQPQEFRLCEGRPSRQIGDAVFYSVHCPQLPGRVFSAKVYRPNSKAAAGALSKPLPPHVNIQQLLVHFPQCPGPERDVSAEDRMSLESPHGGSTEQGESPERTVASLLSDGYAADVERELPRGTLEDFVRDGAALRRAQPQLYERQLGLLLLQVARGLLHLREHGAVCAELQPRDVILAWPGNGNGGGAEGGMEGAGERGAAEGGACGRTEGLEGGVEMEVGTGAGAREGENPGAPVQELWKRWGPPRAALTAFQPQSEREASGDSYEGRLGRLLLLCLHRLPETPVPPPDPRPSGWDPPQGPPSPSPSGLLRLAHLLLDPGSGVRAAEAAGVLQVLLWGPRAELFLQGPPGAPWPALLAGWLSLKRSLLLQELSELALSGAGGRPDREDVLCLQYLSAAEPDAVLKIAALLGLHHTAP
ncbi:inactive tyrosine-protein kinase PRAG1 isoform X1 [Anguilla rostrata]|uniref:inactive tyrosine-protein kinase PRAG1 isoform X1 n=2 Tax=Anguilla rostrata TaxID=7938 RepID=UPI0030D5FE9C